VTWDGPNNGDLTVVLAMTLGSLFLLDGCTYTISNTRLFAASPRSSKLGAIGGEALPVGEEGEVLVEVHG